MTREEITTLVSPFLSNITVAEGANLLRAEYIVRDALVGIYYFEFSDDDLSVNVEQFQEDYISSDYYNHPGHLQWNHYLIFVRADGMVNKERKNEIEKNDIYTRKFVFSPADAKKYFTYSFSDQRIETDIVSTWKEKLRAVDLDEVYTDNYYTESIPRFLNNDVQKENIAEQNLAMPLQASLHIDRITNITLRDNYRTHPKPKRSYDFSQVNLIRGVNGSGKTSLLTAIELIVAGKSISEPSSPEPGNCIVAVYNNDSTSIDEYTPNDNTKYRKRDVAWYSSSYQTGNELYRTFNRYNYFDSDAAYNLAYNEDNRHITKYLSALALGPEFGRIQDRIRGFEERLGKELRSRENTIEDQKTRIDDAQKVIQGIALAADPKSLFMLFKDTAIENGWKAALPSAMEDETITYEKAYQDAYAIAGTLRQLLELAKLRSLLTTREELVKVNADILKVTEAKNLYEESRLKVSISGKLVEQMGNELEILTRAKAYFDNPDSFFFPAMEDELSKMATRIAINQSVDEAFTPLSENKIFQSSETFSFSKNSLENVHTETLRKQRETSQQKEALKETLDQLQGVVSDIKALGTKYLSLEENPSYCPLCETPYEKAVLTERIQRINLDSSENGALKIFNDQLLRLEEEIGTHVAAITELRKIEKAIELLYPSDVYTKFTFDKIYQELLKAKQNLQTDIRAKENLELKKVKLEQKGFTKVQVNNFKREFEQAFSDIAFIESSTVVYQELFTSHTKAFPDLQRSFRNDVETESNRKATFEELTRVLGISPAESDPEKYLLYISGTIDRIIEQFTKLQDFLTFQESEEFIDIAAKFDKLPIAFQNYRKSLSDQTQLEFANQAKLSAQQQINDLQPVIEKIKKALDVLSGILTKDNEETILGDFLKTNEKDIQEIFQILHTPKEFSHIEFDHSTKNLYLHKPGSERPLTLNKISTGQRSALALSIFLALHKKINQGPKVLLFDDPVTYTDDLNILSFLDYLRELVINENRQLFFATANQKLAGLFEKKFAFLANGCQTISLERVD